MVFVILVRVGDWILVWHIFHRIEERVLIWSQKRCAWVPRPSWMSAKIYARLPHIIAVAGACISAPIIGYNALPLAPLDQPASHTIIQQGGNGNDPAFMPPAMPPSNYSNARARAYAPTNPTQPVSVPEPSSAILLLTAAIALAAAKRLTNHRQNHD
jgi:hypothetical protein